MQEVAQPVRKSKRGWGGANWATTHHQAGSDAGRSNFQFRALRSLAASLFKVVLGSTGEYSVRGVGGAEFG
jgi:hypothetical protein